MKRNISDMNKRIFISFLIIFMYQLNCDFAICIDISKYKENKHENKSYCFYSASHNGKYFMVSKIFDYDSINLSIFDMKTSNIIHTENFDYCQSGLLPFRVSDDGNKVLIQSKSVVYNYDLLNNKFIDSFGIDIFKPYSQYYYEIMPCRKIENDTINKNKIVLFNTETKSDLVEITPPENYKFLNDVVVSKNLKYYAYSIRSELDFTTKIIVKSFDGIEEYQFDAEFVIAMELSFNANKLIYQESYNKLVSIDLKTGQRKIFSYPDYKEIFFIGDCFSDDEKTIKINLGKKIEIYDFDSAKITKSINTRHATENIFIKNIVDNRIAVGSVNLKNHIIIDLNNDKQESNPNILLSEIKYNSPFLDICNSSTNDFVKIFDSDEFFLFDYQADTIILHQSFRGDIVNLNKLDPYQKVSNVNIRFADEINCYYSIENNNIKEIDINTNLVKDSIYCEKNIFDVIMLPDTNFICYVAGETLYFYDRSKKYVIKTYISTYKHSDDCFEHTLGNIRISNDNKFLYIGTNSVDGGVYILKLEIDSLKLNAEYYDDFYSSENKYITNDGKYLIRNNHNSFLQLFEMSNGSTLDLEWVKYNDNEIKPKGFGQSGFSHDGKYIFAVADKRLFVWDYKTKKHIKTYMSETEFVQMRISNVSNTLFAFKKDNTFEVLKYEDDAGVFDIHPDNKGMKSYITKNNAVLTIETDCSIDTEFELFDAAGNVIGTHYNCTINDRGIEFAANGLSTGTYFLTIKNNKTTNTFKIMVIGE